MPKSNKMQMRLREADILEMLAQGFSRSEIGKMLCTKHKCSSQSIERQHDKIIKAWVEQDKDKLDEAKAQYILQLSDIYKQAYKHGQFKLASEVIEKQAKLMGLYNPKVEQKKEAPRINIIEKDAPLSVVPSKKAENDE